MRTYFTFVFDYPQLNDNTTRWDPSMNVFQKYPHLEGIVTIKCDVAGDERTKEFSLGKKWGYRLGYMEADDTALANFGTSVSDVVSKAQTVLSQYEIKPISNDELRSYISSWTTLNETSPGSGIYVLSEASDGVEAVLVDTSVLPA